MATLKRKKKKPALGLGGNTGHDTQRDRQWWMQLGYVSLAFVLLVAALTREPEQQELIIDDLDTAVLSKEDVRAAFFFESVDLQQTQEARAAATESVPDYYRVDRSRVQEQIDRTRERVQKVEEQRPVVEEAVVAAWTAAPSSESLESVVTKTVTAFATNLKEDETWASMPDATVLALWLTPDLESLPQRVVPEPVEAPAEVVPAETEVAAAVPAPAPVLVEPAVAPHTPGSATFSVGDQLADLTIESLNYVLTSGIRSAALPPGGAEKPVVVVRDAALADLNVASAEMLLGDVPDMTTAKESLAERLRETARRAAKDEEESSAWARLHEAALALAEPALTDTVQFDRVATAGAVERAREAVEPILHEIEAGEIVQEGGKRWTEQSRSDVKAYLALYNEGRDATTRYLSAAGAHILIVLLLLLGLRRSVFLLLSEPTQNATRMLNLALLLLCGSLVAGRAASYFEPTGFVLPMAAGGILYAILAGPRVATLYSLLACFLVSIQFHYDWRLMMVGGTMSLAGIFGLDKVRRRSDMTTACIRATVAGLAAMLAVLLATDSLFSETAIQRITMILLNGVICMMVVPALLSPLERLFGITTDMQLLEYSDLNNEVLSRLAIEVPATFAHSLMIGQLAEAAADAIGANGLKARVMAYYHDIGKMWRPEYYSENQGEYNVHDDLAPRMSARAIAAHVSQGADMARQEYHLPEPIVAGILEHHGTCPIGYFLSQAQKQQKHGDVDESDYRYPGPKPQSPETAILMICDGCESGVRSIKNPNEERVREFVEKIIDARAEDGQFDECDLTTRQLDTIAEVITKRICSNVHKRVAYPDSRKKEEGNIIPMAGGSGSA